MGEFFLEDGIQEKTHEPRAPVITQLYGTPIRQRMPAVEVPAGVRTDLALTFLDAQRHPVQLPGDPQFLEVCFREAVLRDRPRKAPPETIEICDCETGRFRVQVPSKIVDHAGIYLVEFGLRDEDQNLRQVDSCYLSVTNTAWQADQGRMGPPTQSEVRMSLRDSDPVENELLGACDFDLAEHCLAGIQTVRFWNDQPPMLQGHVYDSRTFPFWNIWLLGIQYYLFQYAEEHYRRNQLTYSAGGVGVDDKNRLQPYMVAVQNRKQDFTRAVIQQKARLNLEGGCRRILSGFPF